MAGVLRSGMSFIPPVLIALTVAAFAYPAAAGAGGRDLAAYNFEAVEVEGELVCQIPEEKKAMIEKDQLWEAYPLKAPAGRIRVVKSIQLFESGRLIAP